MSRVPSRGLNPVGYNLDDPVASIDPIVTAKLSRYVLLALEVPSAADHPKQKI
ncbi:hypothetical protein Poly41_35340 [Novipirellula artificiosorum]|uniref:Uncharacterized protein n=1 Tax=Novipirellula artificiosorum TaxID=2528016 RepID=A0A5C6DMM4_9BACT|nr:hypothetical protein Poly41_35340 [Novipirellula artificiosorum]